MICESERKKCKLLTNKSFAKIHRKDMNYNLIRREKDLLVNSLHFFLSDSQIIENVHSILATAASKLNLELYEHLTTLIKKKWEISEGRVREKLLRLIGLIGREAKSSKSIEATLAVLWEVVSRLCFNF
jgi:hypothetical protein